MSVKHFATIAVILVVSGIATTVQAQGLLPSGKEIGERFDEFGRTIFGGIFSDEDAGIQKEKPRKSGQASRPATRKYDPADLPEEDNQYRSGSILKPSNSNQQIRTGESSARSVPSYRVENYNSSRFAASAKANPPRQYSEESKKPEIAEMAEDARLMPTARSGRPLIDAPHNNPADAEEATDQDYTSSLPLHERFSQFQRSAFDGSAKGETLSPSPDASMLSPEASRTTSSSAASRVAPVVKSRPQTLLDPSSDSGESPRPVADKAAGTNAFGRPTPAKRPAGAAETGVPLLAERNSPTTRMDGQVIADEKEIPKPNMAKNPGLFAEKPEMPAVKESNVLFTRKGPVLSVETQGPRKITVGKESSYEVKIINAGDVAAEDLIVLVDLPEWAEVIGADAGAGATQVGAGGPAPLPFQWKVGHLEARSQEKLALRIVPRQSRPFDLAVRWQYKPVTSQAMIEVQEPRLEMQLEGPREVFYGRRETYRLKISNSGTGNAEGVTIKLVPIGTGENVPAIYKLGLLGAGEQKIIEVELTARQSGILEIQVEAKGDASNAVQLSEKVLVRRAGLEIDVDGPKLQFVGAAATYSLRVRNPGNAPAKNINFTALLPAGLKYAGGLEGARSEAGGNKVQWTIDTLDPEAAQTFAIKCIMGAAGVNRLEITAAAEDDLSATAVAATQVESVANLTLDVQDPGGPVRVGDETAYTIHVVNRGTKDAEGVEVIGYFSRGIEPTSAEGGTNQIGPGQVVFTPIPALAAGGEAVLKINARAEAPGNHVFRAEVHCKTLGSRLVSEDTTLYYQDAPAIPQNSQARPFDRGVR